jgi:phospholipid/cholesterol/gamma-HCH transport system substrate-binding protein
MNPQGSIKLPFIGLGTVVLLVALITAALAQYNQAFTRTDNVTLYAPRAGLLMEPGTVVKLHGVPIGMVGTVDADNAGARLTLKIDPVQFNNIPDDVRARIVPPTIFGAKYVELLSATLATPGNQLRVNTAIHGTDVTVELNSTFDVVMKALSALDPAKLNIALGSIANSIDGKGDQIGNIIRRLDQFLAKFNPSLPQLTRSLPLTTSVINDYAHSFPPLIDTASNLGVTSNTIVDQQAQFGAFWLSLTQFGGTTSQFLEDNGGRLITALDVLKPTAAVLARYSPVLPCLIAGVSYNSDYLRAIMGGPDHGGVHQNASLQLELLPGLPAYQYPEDLPKTGVDTGPDCHGLPLADPKGTPYVQYETGANPYPNKNNNLQISRIRLTDTLFGGSSTGRAG